MRSILVATLVAGSLDITATSLVVTLRGTSPLVMLRGVAGGLLGKSALDGGLGTSALGLVIHFLIAAMSATLYVLASDRISWLNQHAFIAGPLYGIAVYSVMNFIVTRVSALHRPFPSITAMLIQIPIHILCVGLPIALIARAFSDPGWQATLR